MFFYEEHNYGEETDKYIAYQLKNETYPCHFHRCYELISLIEGQLLLQLDEKEHLLNVGDMILIFPNQLHGFTTLEHAIFNIVIFSPELIGDFLAKYSDCVPENPVLRETPLSLDKICIYNIYEQKSFLYHICARYSVETPMIKKTALDVPTLLHHILSFVGKHYTESCTLQELAIYLGYEYTYLSKYFKDKMKLSFTAYVNQIRIRHACALLKDKNHSIFDIAFQCGYDTVRTFNRNFFNITGLTPKEYRNL